MDVKARLDEEVAKRDREDEVSQERLDPILVAKRHRDPTISLICAMFSYGGVKQIVKFLDSLDFSLLSESDEEIRSALKNHYYRFQTSEDVAAIFIALKRLDEESSLEATFKSGYDKESNVVDGVNAVISRLLVLNPRSSRGYNFLVGKVTTKTKGAGALKRWMMFLRWMVRDDRIDMGLWKGVDKADLIMPLDTHTFGVGSRLGLLHRKTCDLQAALELTRTLRGFDENDPLKYDFALYRLGQEKLL
jgi:uncharacterized protein (TIGR02757 family)